MDKELKDKFPTWCFEHNPLAVTLTDDIDSLIGCMVEQKAKGNKINYFYTFESVYIMDKNVRKPTLGIDLAFTNGRCWDNHVTRLNQGNKVNKQSANINSILNISGDNYFDKYCMSTAIMMWSFYDLPLPASREGKMILLAIDSGFLGHYDNRFKQVHNTYLEMLGFEELIDILNNTTQKEYELVQEKYRMSEKITIDDNGYLQTKLPLSLLSKVLDIKLELPKQPFTLHKQFKNVGRRVQGDEVGELGKNIISFALTRKKYYKYTVAI
ncbi:hypothetical protein KGF86_06945 [Ornithinibacillus massiliensis]|uniref:DUF2971 domain-containing protein n=1 Tax=Ornithinibacillus massiliensis TaxID=1944633 RepID=A0ABS5MC89_9BACI|nr:hypothetical protein [Ornithinibacillus massiliensis]MBS3679944.1 hypothetical protein [Ornithinibacillus massiliensis]